MILNNKILVKNYKCFDSSGGGFEKISPINLIIGKNNSGKSSLVDLIRFIIEKKKEIIESGRDNSNPEVIIEHKLTEQEILRAFPSGTSGGGIPGRNFFEYGKQFIDKTYTYKLEEKGKKTFIHLDAEFVTHARKQIDALAGIINEPLANKIFCNIAAERDILPEETNAEIIFTPNGSGATNAIQQIINRTNRDSRLIEQELLNELNAIINPDIIFTRILVQLKNNNHWEIFFEDANKKSIALSKMGSGIKTVLLVLLNLVVRPVIENKNRNSYVFAFEELENNLHPSLQRRLYNYIRKYSENHSSYFFLTTHSNVVIDAFGTDKNSQLIHVINDGDKSNSTTILSYNGTKQILNDLGIKASDILQCNGVIWVEGPSDRNYINRWIGILAPDLKEGLHYSIMFYGGRLLANLSFDFEWFNNEVIPLLKINKNAFVVLDRDGKTMNAKINDTKNRITKEIGENNSWITKGREIENYLSDKTISDWLLDKHGFKTSFTNDKNTKLEENIANSSKTINLKYNLSKTVFSSEIADYIDKDSLAILDLNENLKNLLSKIREWNE
ncbi:ATP-dependent nuclease [Saccharicrinis fermentans]|uniref:Putative ATPase n=1 Tax=Saccharicrinis fermentans DSM 9555 = JCM 21142 TaxID=869213 RepID=W7YU31_9BACT|nr:AAA family ATPase [Saccharicrinis fermentans]GAF05954.1 putative ATPase [Saccharicrinis fermentans DSM 9555 = JCM 21142]